MVQGRGIDAPLNVTGQKQAKLFYEKYGDVDFDYAFCSTLQRSKQSIAHFSHLPLIETEGLDEISWGSFEGKKINLTMRAEFNEQIYKWEQGDYHAKIGNGESLSELNVRQDKFVDLLNEITWNKILVCMHGRAMRALICKLCNIELKELNNFEHTNLSLYVLEGNLNNFHVKIANDTSHLNEN